MVGLMVAGALAPWLAARAAREAEIGAAGTRAAVTDQTQALLDGFAELEVAGAVPARLSALAAAEVSLASDLDAAARPAALAAAVQALATGSAMIGALLLGAGPVASGTLPAVWLPVLVLLPLAAFEATAGLPVAAVEAVRGTRAARRLLALLDQARPQQHRDTVTLGPGPHRLSAAGLACGWSAGAPVVTDIDLDLEPGQAVAVLGASGSGKTTLLLTLAGLLPPVRGTVRLDGVDLADIDQAWLRAAVSYTAEDAHVFATTVRENLKVAAGDVADGVLLGALDDVGLGGWVRALPRGLGTLLGSGGHDVSGGERRRLLLARALLTHAGILLIDEGAEHLDPESAGRLMHDLAVTARDTGRTVVVATHSDAGLDAFDGVVTVGGPGARRPVAHTR